MRVHLFGVAEHKEQQVHVKTALEQAGHTVVVPKKEEKDPATKDQKKRLLDLYQEALAESNAVLVMNYSYNGVKHAIPPATLIAMGVAVYQSKPVYVYGEFPIEHKAALAHLGVVELKGDLSVFL
jgi:hypothetical protein